MSDGFFWGLTPKALGALLAQRGKAQERETERLRVFAGTIAAAVYNVNRDTKKHPKAFTADDIFPQAPKAQTETEVKAVFLNLAAAFATQSRPSETASPPER